MAVPTGSFNPMNLTTVSLTTKARESVLNDLEKSLPAVNCQPTVLPYSWETQSMGKSRASPGSFPFQLNPPEVDQTAVSGLQDSAISTAAPVLFNSSRTIS